MAFMRVMKVSRDQHSACAQALLEATGGTLDANLNKALKEIPIVGICIVEFTIKIHVIFYLGNGIWAADEVSSFTIPDYSKISLYSIGDACRNFIFIKASIAFFCLV